MLMLHSYTLIHIFRLKKRLSINHFGMGKIFVKVLQKQKLLRLQNLIISQKIACAPKIARKLFKSKVWTCCELVFFGEFNEQSLVILWVNWFKNESFWKRFTCNFNELYEWSFRQNNRHLCLFFAQNFLGISLKVLSFFRVSPLWELGYFSYI